MLISTTTFLSRVSGRTGLEPEACGRLVEQTMKALAEQLRATTVQMLGGELPPTLAVWVEAARFSGASGVAPMLASGLAREHVATVLGALAELLPAPVLEALRVELHEDVGVLLTPREQHPADASSWRSNGA